MPQKACFSRLPRAGDEDDGEYLLVAFENMADFSINPHDEIMQSNCKIGKHLFALAHASAT
jgi:hypothetical protein